MCQAGKHKGVRGADGTIVCRECGTVRPGRVLNMRDVMGSSPFDVPAGVVYIGRPSKWGNPFTHLAAEKTKAQFQVATREEAVARYREWILAPAQAGLRAQLHELRGKDLACWCAPNACHGDVLVELAAHVEVPG